MNKNFQEEIGERLEVITGDMIVSPSDATDEDIDGEYLSQVLPRLR